MQAVRSPLLYSYGMHHPRGPNLRRSCTCSNASRVEVWCSVVDATYHGQASESIRGARALVVLCLADSATERQPVKVGYIFILPPCSSKTLWKDVHTALNRLQDLLANAPRDCSVRNPFWPSHHRVQEAECKQKLPPLSGLHPLQSLLVHDDCVRPEDAGLQASRWFVGYLRFDDWVRAISETRA